MLGKALKPTMKPMTHPIVVTLQFSRQAAINKVTDRWISINKLLTLQKNGQSLQHSWPAMFHRLSAVRCWRVFDFSFSWVEVRLCTLWLHWEGSVEVLYPLAKAQCRMLLVYSPNEVEDQPLHGKLQKQRPFWKSFFYFMYLQGICPTPHYPLNIANS